MKIKLFILLSIVWLFADCKASQTTTETKFQSATPANVAVNLSPDQAAAPPIAAPTETGKTTTAPQSQEIGKATVPPQANIPTADAKKPTESAAIVLAAFDKIQKGMSYPQVAAIIGSPGENAGSFKDEGGAMTLYRWTGKAEKGDWVLSAKFENGKLADKSQFGLK